MLYKIDIKKYVMKRNLLDTRKQKTVFGIPKSREDFVIFTLRQYFL